MDIQKIISEELSVKEKQVAAAVELLDAGNTVPFIARYRKEATGGLDDEALRRLSERLTYLRNLEKRKEEVRALIAAQDRRGDRRGSDSHRNGRYISPVSPEAQDPRIRRA